MLGKLIPTLVKLELGPSLIGALLGAWGFATIRGPTSLEFENVGLHPISF